MGNFKEYSGYYDLLYNDKDYKGEADYLNRLIQQHARGAKSILNLGCGTGGHDYILAEQGYDITAVDLSADMLEIANGKLGFFPLDNKPCFLQGDIRSVRLKRKFDAVVSLFHVMSYQVTNEDVQAALLTAYEHLNEGGVFLFDCWYGPGVFTDLPDRREKKLANDFFEIKRVSTPIMHPNENCVDVFFDVDITNRSSGLQVKLNEIHKMRYFFLPELLLFFKYSRLSLLSYHKWLTNESLDCSAWNALFILKKNTN